MSDRIEAYSTYSEADSDKPVTIQVGGEIGWVVQLSIPAAKSFLEQLQDLLDYLED